MFEKFSINCGIRPRCRYSNNYWSIFSIFRISHITSYVLRIIITKYYISDRHFHSMFFRLNFNGKKTRRILFLQERNVERLLEFITYHILELFGHRIIMIFWQNRMFTFLSQYLIWSQEFLLTYLWVISSTSWSCSIFRR